MLWVGPEVFVAQQQTVRGPRVLVRPGDAALWGSGRKGKRDLGNTNLSEVRGDVDAALSRDQRYAIAPKLKSVKKERARDPVPVREPEALKRGHGFCTYL